MSEWWQGLDPELLAEASPEEIAFLYQQLQVHLDRERPPERITNPEGWLREFLPGAFPLPFGAHHKAIIGSLPYEPTGIRAFVGAARGSGKTTSAFLGLPSRAIAQGSHKFICIVAVVQSQAESRLSMLRNVAKADTPLTRAYPRLQLFRTPAGRPVLDQTSEVWLNGARLVAIGAESPFRGLVRDLPDGSIIRPDLLIFDDVETEEQARSKLRTDRLEEWIFAELANLGGPGEKVTIDVIGIGTTLTRGAVASRALRREGRFRGWRILKFPAEATAEKNEETGKLVAYDRRLKPLEQIAVPKGTKAGERFATWPEGQPLARLNRLITPGDENFIGSSTYAREYLLDPVEREDQPVQAHMLRWGSPERELSRKTMGVDPASTTKTSSDYSAIVRGGWDSTSGEIHVQEAWQGKVLMKDLFDRVERISKSTYSVVAYEGVAGFAWGEQELADRQVPYVGYKPDKDPFSAFLPTALLFQQGKIIMADHLKGSELEEQILGFPGGLHDDLLRALMLMCDHIQNFGEVAAASGDQTWEAKDDPYAAERRSSWR